MNIRHLDQFVADAAAMQALGAGLGGQMEAGMVLALCGPLGAGKTCFVQGLARGLGFEGLVTSPTFPILHELRGGRLPLYHFDFYRLETADELTGVDFEEWIGTNDGVIAIEWADRFPDQLPPETCWLRFELSEDGGRRVLSA